MKTRKRQHPTHKSRTKKNAQHFPLWYLVLGVEYRIHNIFRLGNCTHTHTPLPTHTHTHSHQTDRQTERERENRKRGREKREREREQKKRKRERERPGEKSACESPGGNPTRRPPRTKRLLALCAWGPCDPLAHKTGRQKPTKGGGQPSALDRAIPWPSLGRGGGRDHPRPASARSRGGPF